MADLQARSRIEWLYILYTDILTCLLKLGSAQLCMPIAVTQLLSDRAEGCSTKLVYLELLNIKHSWHRQFYTVNIFFHPSEHRNFYIQFTVKNLIPFITPKSQNTVLQKSAEKTHFNKPYIMHSTIRLPSTNIVTKMGIFISAFCLFTVIFKTALCLGSECEFPHTYIARKLVNKLFL